MLVKAHEMIFGESFTSENKADYLQVENNFITKIFSTETSNCSFTINGETPNDGNLKDDSYAPGGKSYTGYCINQAIVNNGDNVEFFLYKDSSALDNYPIWKQNGVSVDSLTVTAGATVNASVDGYCIGYYGCVPMNALVEKKQVKTLENAQLAWVSAANGSLSDIQGAAVDENGTVSFTAPEAAGEYYLTAYMPDSKIKDDYETPVILKLLKVTVPSVSISVPNDATLFVGSKKGNTHFVPFIEQKPVKVENSDSETKTYYYNLSAGEKFNYRVSGENYVTYAGIFSAPAKRSVPNSLNVTTDQLNPAGKTKTTVDRNLNSNKGYNVADIYLNINAQGYLKLEGVDSTYQIVNLRNWETVDTTTNNYFIEPDFHYTVIDESGNASNDVVTVDDKGLVKAVGNGTAIVLVTYDAINVASAEGGPFFGAIWPENTGVFVVSVGAETSGISTGMTINESFNTPNKGKNAETALDAEHDVIYYVGEEGSYTFTPVTNDVTVSVANPTVTETEMTFNRFTRVNKNADGSYNVPLKEGRNIVKIEKDGRIEYQVIAAKKVTITINNGEPVAAGDSIEIKFDKVYHPVNKLAGLYNYGASIIYKDVDGYQNEVVGSVGGSYNFASSEASQTLYTLNKTEMWGKINYTKKSDLIVPEDYNKGTFKLSGGTIFFSGWGDFAGNHRGISLETGRNPNLNAGSPSAYLGQLPDIEIPIVATSEDLESISLSTDGVKKEYFEGDAFDTTNLVVTAEYAGDVTRTVTNYTVSPSVLTKDTTKVTITYRGKTATIPVSVKEVQLTGIEVETQPTKTTYTVGEVFNPNGIKIKATYDNTSTADVTSKVTYSNSVFNTAGDEIAVKVTYTEKDITKETTLNVKVNPSQGGTTPADTISVSFTLLGDSHHGEPTKATGTHTLKSNNLQTWVSRTSVTLPKDSNVAELLEKALGTAGIPFTNPSGNYVDSIRGLSEFTNGQLSGWMYTLNGRHSKYGVGEQKLRNGDEIVFHYTDDYTVEEGSDRWTDAAGGGSGEVKDVTTSGASGSATTTAPTDVKVSEKTNADGTKETVAAVKVDSKHHDEIIKQAAEKKSAEIVLEVSKADSKGADNVQLTLDVTFVKNVADKTNADLTVNTENGKVTLDQETIKTVLGAAKGATITLEVSKVAKPTEAQKKAAGANGHVIRLVIKSGNQIISDFNKGKATVMVELVSRLIGKKVAAIHIADDGTIEQLAGKVLTVGGKQYYEFATPHFSTFAIVDADEVGLDAAEEPAVDAKALVAKLTPAARSAKTAKKNVKVTTRLDKQDKEIISQLKDAGYTVKYRFYRSTKKAAGYKAAVTKKASTYTSTSGKKGTKYFYKVQVRVYDASGKLAAKTALKQCRYASRTWNK